MDTPVNRPSMRKGLIAKFPRRPHQHNERLTPPDGIFTLAHFGIPEIDQRGWTIAIDGMVRQPMRITVDELMRRPKRTMLSFHECAGNPLKPKQAVRAIANLTWGGADLKELLDEAGIEPEAKFLWSYGVDHGEYGDTESECYLKDLPIERLMAGDVLLAYEMSGKPLTLEHGAPIRLFIPGFYGTNSVKWLWRMTLADRRAEGPLTTTLYNDPPRLRANGDQTPRPVWGIPPESIIVAPAPGAELRVGEPVEIWGWAWAAAGVAQVEVSVDAGGTYRRARLADREQWSWQRFSFDWRPTTALATALSSRATDFDGVVQPAAAARNSVYKVNVIAIER